MSPRTRKPKHHPGVYPRATARHGTVWDVVASVGGRQKVSRGYATQDEAIAALEALKVEMRGGQIGTAPARLTLGEYVERQWLPFIEGSVTAGTARVYRLDTGRIVQHLGSVRLRALTGYQVDGFVAALRKSGLGATSVLHTYHRLDQALRKAVSWGLISANPCDRAQTPAGGKYRPPRLEMGSLKRLLEEADATPYGTLVYLALATGMRFSELAALRWDSVDVALRQLSIPASKTESGIRTIALGDLTLERLHRHRVAQMQRYVSLGASPPPLVFVSPVGHQLVQPLFWPVWDGIRRRAGLPTLHFHDLRHAHATLGAKQGVHPDIMRARLGHADSGITREIYTHIEDVESQREAAAAIERVLE